MSEDAIEVERELGRLHLPGQPNVPAFVFVQRHIEHTMKVARDLGILLVKQAHAISAELANEEPELEHDVLTGTLLKLGPSRRFSSDVVRREQNDREHDIRREILELLDDRAPFVR